MFLKRAARFLGHAKTVMLPNALLNAPNMDSHSIAEALEKRKS